MNKVYDEQGRKYQVITGFIPSNYSIWNALLLKVDGKTFLKLYNNDLVVGSTVDAGSLLALEVNDELGDIIESSWCGGRNPKEVKENLSSESDYVKAQAEIIKPYIEALFNTKI